jgi:hypothetical protein
MAAEQRSNLDLLERGLLHFGMALLLSASLGGLQAHADAPPAKIAPEAATTLPAELLTIPAPAPVEPGVAVHEEAPLAPAADASEVAPEAPTRISLDSRDRPPLPAVADGDRERSLLVRLRWPF